MYPEIVENYKDYTPPFEIVPTIQRALKIVPKKLLRGIRSVNLINAASLSRKRRRSTTKSRKRKVKIKECLGLYHGDNIEIFIDNIVDSTKKNRYFRRQYYLLEIVRVLFHEIGHHIHLTKRPERGEKETIADRYMIFYWKKYIWRNSHRIGLALINLTVLVAIHPNVWKIMWDALWDLRKQVNRHKEVHAI